MIQNRVLIVHPSGASGIWHYANSLSRALVHAGFEVALAAQVPYEQLGELAGAPVYGIGPRMARFNSPIRQVAHRVVNHAEKLARFGALIARYRPSIVHLHAPMGGFDWMYFRVIRHLGARVVYTAHDAHPLTRDSTWFDSARLRAADHILVHSRRCEDLLVAGGIARAKVSFIPHGSYAHLCLNADLAKTDARRRLGLPEGSHVVLFFGALSAYKGLETLIPAFQRVVLRDAAAHLILAGQPLMDIEPFLEEIRSYGLRDRVSLDLRYIPFEDFACYFRSADVVVLPYQRISQSGILHLAYGFSRPVVVTDVGGLGEAVVEDGTGVVVPAGDLDALAGALGAMISDPATAEQMGSRGRMLSETKYSWQEIALATARMYRALPGGHVASPLPVTDSHDG